MTIPAVSPAQAHHGSGRTRHADPDVDLSAIDGRPWSGEMRVQAWGVRIGLRTNAPECLPRVAAALPPGAAALVSGEVDVLFSLWLPAGLRRHRGAALYRDDRLLIEHDDPRLLLALLEDFVRAEVAYFADDAWTFVHAGTVAREGRAVVLPGHSFAGKTRLVAALLERGASYLSDDMAVIDEQGRVHPWPVPLGMRGEHPVRRRSLTPPAGQLAGAPVAVALVLFTRFAPDATGWRPRRLAAGQALGQFAAHALAARRMPRQVMARLAAVLGGAPAWQGSRGEAGPVADWVLDQLEGA